MNIKPEQLKALAERMGYDCTIINDSVQYAPRGCRGYVAIYNPLTNDSQAMELMEKLLSEGTITLDSHNDEIILWDCRGREFTAKTLNECITLAAIAMEEDK